MGTLLDGMHYQDVLKKVYFFNVKKKKKVGIYFVKFLLGVHIIKGEGGSVIMVSFNFILISFLFKLGQCILINMSAVSINVNMPKLAQQPIFICCPKRSKNKNHPTKQLNHSTFNNLLTCNVYKPG